MAMQSDPLLGLRQSGISAVGPAPWGTHFCQFYETKADLIAVLVPYFKAGLESGEYCMWITSPPLDVDEAWAALEAAIPDLAAYRRRGCLEILPHTGWYLRGGTFNAEGVLQGWLTKLTQALASGYAGLRLSGNTFWLEKTGWRTFAEYEALIDSVVGAHQMLALCTYSLERCGAAEIADVIKNHQFALLKRDGAWDLIESFARRRMQEQHTRELAVERERLAVTLQSIGDGVIATDTQGRVTSLNHVAEELTGWTQAEAVGRPLSAVFRTVDETRAPGLNLVRAVLERGAVTAFGDMELIAKDGEKRFIADSAAPIRSRGTDPIGIVLVFRDVTEMRHAEDRLRESEARLGLLSRTASRLLAAEEPQAVVNELCTEVMQHLDCQVFFNYLAAPAAGKLRLNAYAGISAQEAARNEWIPYDAAICGCVAQSKQRIIAEDVLHTSDCRVDLVRSYGIQAYCCHPLLDEGELLGTLSFGTRTRACFTADEVELMRTVADQVATAMQRVVFKRALCEANARLVEADLRKNDFLAVLSHELRNPLAPIRNSLFILDRAAPGGEQARRAQRVIDRQVMQLSNLVNDLLDVTRITRNKIQLQKERLELNGVVRRVIEDNRTVFERVGVRLEMTPTAEAVHVYADGMRLAQIIGNLLQNAAKFTRKDGCTRVTLGVEGREAVVRVSDDGVGIAAETLTQLFQPFTQADQTLDRSKGGLGLGLALVKGLVELHGGSVSALSEGIGKGSEFRVRLPLDVGAMLESTAPSVPFSHAPRRVLIIEDNVDAAESLREVLELGEHEVDVAYTGFEGIAKARALLPEVILCDIGLPGMDGYDVARALRAEDTFQGTYLVALSGYAGAEDLQRAAEAGFTRHLAKPPSIEQLEELLSNLPS